MTANRAPKEPAGFRAEDLPQELGPAVIVGAGLAGLFTALRLAPRPVTVISGAALGVGAASVWAQGGIAAALGEGDSPEAHAADTIKAGGGIVDEPVARFVTGEAPARIGDLVRLGVPFDRDAAGRFLLSREAAHSAARVARVSGDGAGFAIMSALVAAVRRTPSIQVIEGFEAEDLVLAGGRVAGVALRRRGRAGGQAYRVPARAVVLATGGIGHLYAVTTNPPHNRGEALGFAARAGALVADAEFVQFHPTAIDIGRDPAPLATEALRGEGAILVNGAGHRFAADAHPSAELAPRDIVARAVFAEIAAGRGAFLDCREAIGRHFPEAFPTVYARCREAGLDPVTQPIPIAPAAHYHMGGLWSDARGRTTLPGLWAVGEVASTGLHGANRLASNSLLEAIVFGARAAADIAEILPGAVAAPRPEAFGKRPPPLPARHRRALVARLRRTMSAHVGVIRSRDGLEAARAAIEDISARGARDTSISNMALAARLVAEAALAREESRGAHFRSDFPEPRMAFARRSFEDAHEPRCRAGSDERG